MTAAVVAVAAARVVGRATLADGRDTPRTRCPAGVLVAPETPAAIAARPAPTPAIPACACATSAGAWLWLRLIHHQLKLVVDQT